MDGGQPRWKGRKKLSKMEIANPGCTSPEDGESQEQGEGGDQPLEV